MGACNAFLRVGTFVRRVPCYSVEDAYSIFEVALSREYWRSVPLYIEDEDGTRTMVTRLDYLDMWHSVEDARNRVEVFRAMTDIQVGTRVRVYSHEYMRKGVIPFGAEGVVSYIHPFKDAGYPYYVDVGDGERLHPLADREIEVVE